MKNPFPLLSIANDLDSPPQGFKPTRLLSRTGIARTPTQHRQRKGQTSQEGDKVDPLLMRCFDVFSSPFLALSSLLLPPSLDCYCMSMQLLLEALQAVRVQQLRDADDASS